MNKEILFHFKRIIITLLFLFVSTFLWADKSIVATNALAYRDMLEKSNNLMELSDGIKLEEAFPVSDEIGMKNDSYKFMIINDKNIKQNYKVYFVSTLPDNYEKLDNKFIRYQIIKDGNIFIDSKTIPADGFLFEDEVLDKNIYELKLWISNDATNEAMDKYFSAKISIK